MKTVFKWLGLTVLLVGALAFFRYRPDRALRVGAGLTAHNLCTATFLANQDPDATFRELLVPMLSGFGPAVHYTVDRSAKTVTATLFGGFAMRARYTEGWGCRLEMDPRYHAPAPRSLGPTSPPDDFAPAEAVTTQDARIAAALDNLFAEKKEAGPKYVKAAVVVKNGKVIAERYAPGIDLHTPLLSYSVAKSFTATLLAILVREGKLRIDAPVPAPEWANPSDPRHALTLDDLLRMQSGLDAPETDSGFDPVSRMLYATDDMAHFAADHPLKLPPHQQFEYTSADTLILDRWLGQEVGGGPLGLRAFADAELFKPTHMDDVTLEFDGEGTFVGAAHVYAPARSYARLGQLYLDDGVTRDGRRILPADWVAYVKRSTLGSDYGAGFWTNDSDTRNARGRVAQGFPRDGFYASGNRGQRIYVIPSAKLVVARFGYSSGKGFALADDLALVKAAIEATK